MSRAVFATLRRFRLLPVPLALLCWAGCTPGNGTGRVVGQLYLRECAGNHDSLKCQTGSAATCVSPDGSTEPHAQLQCLVNQTQCTQFDLDLAPQFFAGEPIEDISTSANQQNRLIIRIQRLGKRLEFDDMLFIDINNQFEVARCVRGRINADGTPDWDPAACINENGKPFLRVGPGNYVQASLTLANSCGAIRDVGTPSVDSRYTGTPWVRGPNDSYIVFTGFGSAPQTDVTDPSKRTPVPVDFKLLFGDDIDAETFVLQIEDDQVVEAQLLEPIFVGPIPESRIHGRIDGEFHFDLQRSASAQAFP